MRSICVYLCLSVAKKIFTMQSTLLFGGTFDPVHNGHVAMLNAAAAQLLPHATIIIPVGSPWQKARQPFASADQRVAMLTLAFPNATIDTREVKREGATYTVDTLRELTRDYPNTHFYWLIGSDSFAKLDTWREPEALAALATFAVVRRASERITLPTVACRHVEVNCTPPPVSSTAIRERIANHQSIHNFVPAAISDYIQQYRIYQP
jgi:nicotinate-nucleotide adenylyltransferase